MTIVVFRIKEEEEVDFGDETVAEACDWKARKYGRDAERFMAEKLAGTPKKGRRAIAEKLLKE